MSFCTLALTHRPGLDGITLAVSRGSRLVRTRYVSPDWSYQPCSVWLICGATRIGYSAVPASYSPVASVLTVSVLLRMTFRVNAVSLESLDGVIEIAGRPCGFSVIVVGSVWSGVVTENEASSPATYWALSCLNMY